MERKIIKDRKGRVTHSRKIAVNEGQMDGCVGQNVHQFHFMARKLKSIYYYYYCSTYYVTNVHRSILTSVGVDKKWHRIFCSVLILCDIHTCALLHCLINLAYILHCKMILRLILFQTSKFFKLNICFLKTLSSRSLLPIPSHKFSTGFESCI